MLKFTSCKGNAGMLLPKRSVFLYGAVPLRNYNEMYSLKSTIGKNSEVFTKGDLVEEASGFVEVLDDTAARPMGICNVTITMASNNQTVAKVEPQITPITPDMTFEMDFDADAAQADVGKYFTIAGATGAQVVTYSSGSATVGQVRLVKLDPRGEGSVRRGEFAAAIYQIAYTPT